MKGSILAVIILITINNISPQQKTSNLVKPGPKGNFVLLAFQAAPLSIDELKSITVERKEAEENKWEVISEVVIPKTLEEFIINLHKYSYYLPEPEIITQVPVKSIWETLDNYKKIDSLKSWANVLAVQLGLGFTYLDTTAEKEIKYQYRITQKGYTENVIQTYLTNPVSYPARAEFNSIKFVRKDYVENSIFLRFRAVGGKKPFAIKTIRKDGMNGVFSEVQTIKTISVNQDTSIYSIRDTSVQANHIYQYFLLPVDYYSNMGQSSDTVLTASYQFSNISLPDKLDAIGLEELPGIKIYWHLKSPEFIKSIRIYKSENWEDKGKIMAEISPLDSVYIDEMIEPMKMFYYQLDLTGMLGEVSPKTPKVFGIYKSNIAPFPPVITNAEGLSNGVKLEIVSNDKFIKGYRIFRSTIYNQELKPISGIVPLTDSVTIFIDTSSELSGKVFYNYAVKAENTSNLVSDFSDTVNIRPLKPTIPNTPLNLTANYLNDKVYLKWSDMKIFDESISGYLVYRREINADEKEVVPDKILYDSLISFTNTSLVDTSIQKGKIFEYSVQSVDYYSGKSEFSTSATVEIKSLKPIPPAGLRAEKFNTGIKLTWDLPYDGDRFTYRLYRKVKGEKEILLKELKSDFTEYLDESIIQTKEYIYSITSLTEDGVESRNSEELIIIP